MFLVFCFLYKIGTSYLVQDKPDKLVLMHKRYKQLGKKSKEEYFVPHYTEEEESGKLRRVRNYLAILPWTLEHGGRGLSGGAEEPVCPARGQRSPGE